MRKEKGKWKRKVEKMERTMDGIRYDRTGRKKERERKRE